MSQTTTPTHDDDSRIILSPMEVSFHRSCDDRYDRKKVECVIKTYASKYKGVDRETLAALEKRRTIIAATHQIFREHAPLVKARCAIEHEFVRFSCIMAYIQDTKVDLSTLMNNYKNTIFFNLHEYGLLDTCQQPAKAMKLLSNPNSYHRQIIVLVEPCLLTLVENDVYPVVIQWIFDLCYNQLVTMYGMDPTEFSLLFHTSEIFFLVNTTEPLDTLPKSCAIPKKACDRTDRVFNVAKRDLRFKSPPEDPNFDENTKMWWYVRSLTEFCVHNNSPCLYATLGFQASLHLGCWHPTFPGGVPSLVENVDSRFFQEFFNTSDTCLVTEDHTFRRSAVGNAIAGSISQLDDVGLLDLYRTVSNRLFEKGDSSDWADEFLDCVGNVPSDFKLWMINCVLRLALPTHAINDMPIPTLLPISFMFEYGSPLILTKTFLDLILTPLPGVGCSAFHAWAMLEVNFAPASASGAAQSLVNKHKKLSNETASCMAWKRLSKISLPTDVFMSVLGHVPTSCFLKETKVVKPIAEQWRQMPKEPHMFNTILTAWQRLVHFNLIYQHSHICHRPNILSGTFRWFPNLMKLLLPDLDLNTVFIEEYFEEMAKRRPNLGNIHAIPFLHLATHNLAPDEYLRFGRNIKWVLEDLSAEMKKRSKNHFKNNVEWDQALDSLSRCIDGHLTSVELDQLYMSTHSSEQLCSQIELEDEELQKRAAQLVLKKERKKAAKKQSKKNTAFEAMRAALEREIMDKEKPHEKDKATEDANFALLSAVEAAHKKIAKCECKDALDHLSRAIAKWHDKMPLASVIRAAQKLRDDLAQEYAKRRAWRLVTKKKPHDTVVVESPPPPPPPSPAVVSSSSRKQKKKPPRKRTGGGSWLQIDDGLSASSIPTSSSTDATPPLTPTSPGEASSSVYASSVPGLSRDLIDAASADAERFSRSSPGSDARSEAASSETYTATSTCEFQDDPPEDLVCPISFKVMDDAVLTTSGHMFQRSAIMGIIDRARRVGTPPVCPVTRDPIGTGVVPVHAVRSRAKEWLQQHPSFNNER